MMLVLASLAVPSLTLFCVCACNCVGISVSYVELFEGGAMVDIIPRQYFYPRKCVCVLLCDEALGTSSLPPVEGEAVQVGL